MSHYEETRYPEPTAFDEHKKKFLLLKSFWMGIKTSKIFQAIKHSRINPYHWGIPEVVADTPQEEQEIARQRGLTKYIDKKGVRCTVNFDGSVEEEKQKTGKVLRGNKDVSSLIPKNEKGELDLMAEEPILISIIPMEGISPVGHVCIQYKDHVINRIPKSMEIDPLYPKYQNFSEYYFIYPSQLGINPKKLIREIDKQNIKHGEDSYNIVTNNCAGNVAQVLKKAGVKDIDFLGYDKAGLTFPTPGNNPFHFGLKDWCLKHGVPVRLDEVAQLYKYHEIPDLSERFKGTRDRYHSYLNERLAKSKLAKVRKKAAKLADKVAESTGTQKIIQKFTDGKKIEDVKIGIKKKAFEKKISDKLFGKVKE